MKRKTILIMGIIIIVSIILFSFISSQSFFQNKLNDKTSENIPNWTIMIYMSGDNWLSDIIPKNLGHIKSVGSTEHVNIITLVDKKGDNNSNLYHIVTYDVNETPLNVLNPKYIDELNMGNKRTLEDFVTWAMANFPAKHYFLDIWGHGEGWKGVAHDGEDYLTLIELENALKTIMENNNGNKLDIIGFDACNMGMLEVFYQIKNYTDIVIASEKEIPEKGWPYYSILWTLNQDTEISPFEFSKLIVNQYFSAYSSGDLNSEKISIALSAINLNKINEIIRNLECIFTERNRLESYEDPDYVDLYYYAQVNGLSKLMDAINQTVIIEEHWSNPKGNEIQHAYGISIYYSKEYDNDYDKLKFSKETQWNDGLKNVF